MDPLTSSPTVPAILDNTRKVNADTASFQGHKLQPTQASQQVRDDLAEGCCLCLEGFENRKISLLPCSHIFHQEPCLNTLLKPDNMEAQNGSETEQNQETKKTQIDCPSCRKTVKNTDITVFDNAETLKANLWEYCENELCTAEGDKTLMSSKARSKCPYPLMTFPHQEANHFLEQNHEEITNWLDESFRQKGYLVRETYFTENYELDKKDIASEAIHNQPAVVIKFEPNANQPKEFYYSSITINQGDSAEGAFKNLIEDLRTDLMFFQLEKHYPAMFDSNTALFVRHYCLEKNKIYIGGENDFIPLRNVFDPSKKSFNWDRLKEAMKDISCEYRELFDKKPCQRYPQENCQPSSSNRYRASELEAYCVNQAIAHTHGVDEIDCVSTGSDDIADVEIPQGEMNTDHFLF